MQCSAWLWRAGPCSAVYCTVVHCSAVQCSSWLFSAVQCSARPCIAVQCSVVHGCAVQWWSVVSCTPLPSAVTTLTLVTQQLTYITYKIPWILADKHFYSLLPYAPTNNKNCWNLARINFFFFIFYNWSEIKCKGWKNLQNNNSNRWANIRCNFTNIMFNQFLMAICYILTSTFFDA